MNLVMRPRHGERGASLAIVLIMITAVALLVGVTLSLTDTGQRATIQLRDQASDRYSADGATNAVLNALKTSGINCLSATNPGVQLGTSATPFYVPQSSQQGSIDAYVTCSSDVSTGTSTSTSTSQPPPVTGTTVSQPAPVTSTSAYLGQGDNTLPSYAVYTTGSSQSDFGLDFSLTAGNNFTFYVENGSVASAKNITMGGSRCLAVRLYNSANDYNGCSSSGIGTGTSGGSSLLLQAAGTCSGSFNPTACQSNVTNIASVVTPAVPGTITAVNPAPTCVKQGNAYWLVFTPGLYTNVTTLNGGCTIGGSTKSTDAEWFTPGNYYFNYGASGPWQWPTQVVGGTLVNGSSKYTTATQFKNSSFSPPSTGACDNPATGTNVSGVAMVFAGSSTIAASTANGNSAEICASSPTSTPPVAIYALGDVSGADIINTSGTGANPYHLAQSSVSSSVGLIDTTPNANNGHAQIYIRGYVWAPSDNLILDLKNSVGQIFNWGVVARNLRLTMNGSSPTGPVFQLPRPNTGVGVTPTTITPPPVTLTTTTTPPAVTSTTTLYTVRYIQVWICTTSQLTVAGECPHTGSASIQARVLTDYTGIPSKILSWSRLN